MDDEQSKLLNEILDNIVMIAGRQTEIKDEIKSLRTDMDYRTKNLEARIIGHDFRIEKLEAFRDGVTAALELEKKNTN